MMTLACARASLNKALALAVQEAGMVGLPAVAARVSSSAWVGVW